MFTFLDERLEEILAGICVLTMTVLVFFQVVMRYVFSQPTSWSDEIAVYAMVWSVYLSVSWAVRERAHIRVMNFVNLFPRVIATGLTVFSDVLWFLFGLFLTWQSVILEMSFWQNKYESPSLEIDQKWPYLCLVVGFALMTFRIAQIYYRWWKYDEPILDPKPDSDDPDDITISHHV
jgi:C4-dicarboxylate transporter, DctQ subunit